MFRVLQFETLKQIRNQICDRHNFKALLSRNLTCQGILLIDDPRWLVLGYRNCESGWDGLRLSEHFAARLC